MAEMLVFMEDQTSDEGIEKTAKLPQRGDVVVVREDGWSWGDMERNNILFALVIVPDATPEDLASLLAPEVPQGEPLPEDVTWASTTNTLQYRGFRLDVDAYRPPPGADPLAAGSDATMTLDAVMGLKVQKEPLPDPKIIGDAGRIIG